MTPLLAVLLPVAACSLLLCLAAPARGEDGPEPAGVLGFTVTDIAGQTVPLSNYDGKVILIVNTASKCGFTKQYDGLEAIYQQYKDQGLVVLGFPCNQFGQQEPGTEDEIAAFCKKNYGVSFPLFAKIDVNGDTAHPLYQYLTADDLAIDDPGPIKWNFEKFLIARTGKPLARYRSKVTPESDELRHAIEAALAESVEVEAAE